MPFHLSRLAEAMRVLMGGVPPMLQAAALPYRRDGDGLKYLLITSRRSRRWILPKGGIDGGEGTAEAAEREAFEEAGAVGYLEREPIGVYDSRKHLAVGASRAMRVVVHPLAVSHLADDFPEAGQRERRWLSPRQAASLVDEPHLSALFLGVAGKLMNRWESTTTCR